MKIVHRNVKNIFELLIGTPVFLRETAFFPPLPFSRLFMPPSFRSFFFRPGKTLLRSSSVVSQGEEHLPEMKNLNNSALFFRFFPRANKIPLSTWVEGDEEREEEEEEEEEEKEDTRRQNRFAS